MGFPDYDADGKTSPYDVAATHHYLGEIKKGGSNGGGGGDSGCSSVVAAIIGILLAIFVMGQIHSCAGG